MTLAAAMSTAGSGLAAIARGTDIMAGNIANAATPGYGRREVVLANLPEGGVRVASVARIVSASLVGDARAAGATVGYGQTIAAFRASFEEALGTAGGGATLSDKVGALEASLIAAASRPEAEGRLSAAAAAARQLTSGITAAATTIEDLRTEADRGIGDDVSRLLSALNDVGQLNRAIITDKANGRDTASLVDERQRAIDAVSTIVPIREVPRDSGRIALFTAGGATLLDGADPVDLTFAPAGRLGPQMQVDTPPVGRLVMNGEVVTADQMGLFAGGSLEARFTIRDQLAPEAQAGLDAFARDLVERFADPTLDPTLGATVRGLFIDGGGTDPLQERGLANRLGLPASLPADGSADWRLRDGLGAMAPGEVGRPTLLTALSERLAAARITVSTGVTSGTRTAAGFAADLAALASTRRVQADGTLARSTAHADALKTDLLADGVDTDTEMRRLVELENAYAANARVIRAADEMLARILEL